MAIHIDCASLPNLVSVDLPVLVKEVSVGYDLLGGEDVLSHSLSHNTDELHMSFRRNETERLHYGANEGLQGKREACCSLVLKLRRKICKSGNIASKPEISVIGKIVNRYVFNEPADYQFLPNEGKGRTEDDKANQSVLEVVPNAFPTGPYLLPSLTNKPSFKASVADSKLFKGLGAILGPRLRADAQLKCIRFGESIERTQEEIDKQNSLNRRSTTNVATIENKLVELFEESPIWSRRQLENIPQLRGRYLYSYLPGVCYVYLNGPFKGMLVRHGYDVTAHPECRYHQVISVRFNILMLKQIRIKIWEHLGRISNHFCVDLDRMSVFLLANSEIPQKVISSATGKGKYIHMKYFGVYIQTQIVFQLFQLTEFELFQFVSSLKRLETCHPTSGYFSAAQIGLIRGRILHQFISKIQNILATPKETLFANNSSNKDNQESDEVTIGGDNMTTEANETTKVDSTQQNEGHKTAVRNATTAVQQNQSTPIINKDSYEQLANSSNSNANAIVSAAELIAYERAFAHMQTRDPSYEQTHAYSKRVGRKSVSKLISNQKSKLKMQQQLILQQQQEGQLLQASDDLLQLSEAAVMNVREEQQQQQTKKRRNQSSQSSSNKKTRPSLTSSNPKLKQNRRKRGNSNKQTNDSNTQFDDNDNYDDSAQAEEDEQAHAQAQEHEQEQELEQEVEVRRSAFVHMPAFLPIYDNDTDRSNYNMTSSSIGSNFILSQLADVESFALLAEEADKALDYDIEDEEEYEEDNADGEDDEEEGDAYEEADDDVDDGDDDNEDDKPAPPPREATAEGVSSSSSSSSSSDPSNKQSAMELEVLKFAEEYVDFLRSLRSNEQRETAGEATGMFGLSDNEEEE